MPDRKHQTLASQLVFDGKIFDVFVDQVRLPSGQEVEREVVRHPGAVGVVAVMKNQILLVRQMRHAPGQVLLEIPAGKLDVPGEDPSTCAHRELVEETGYRCRMLEPLFSFYNSPGFSDELFHLFLAVDIDKFAESPIHDLGEPISIEWLSIDRAFAGVMTGEIRDAKTIIGVLVAKLRFEEGIAFDE